MSEQEINEAIHAIVGQPFVGLQKCGLWYGPNGNGYTSHISEAGRYTMDEAKKHEYLKGSPDEFVRIVKFPIPDYCNDLNAMHEAEKALSRRQAVLYRLKITEYSDGPRAAFQSVEAALCHATARQRAEAFLKTVQQNQPAA